MTPEDVLNLVADEGGITINPFTGEQPEIGYVVCANPERGERYPDVSEILEPVQVSDLPRFVWQNGDLLSAPGHYLGIWIDEDTDDVLLDVVKVVLGRELALDIARQHKQKAIYDLITREGIYLQQSPGTSFCSTFTPRRVLSGEELKL